MQQQQYSGNTPADSTQYDKHRATLAAKVFDEIAHPNMSLKNEITFRLRHVQGSCAAMSSIISEANVKTNSDTASDNIGRFMAMVENELTVIYQMIEHSLVDRITKPTHSGTPNPAPTATPQEISTGGSNTEHLKREIIKTLEWVESPEGVEQIWQAVRRVVEA